MAKTYKLTSNAYEGRTLTLTCTQTPNIAGNYSTINWTLTSAGGSSLYYSVGPTTVTINGTVVRKISRTEYTSQKFPAAKGSVSGSLKVYHSDNGSKSITVSLITAIYTATTSTKSGTWALDKIDRYASITSAPDFNNTNNPKITYKNILGNGVASLQVCIADSNAKIIVNYRDIPKTASEYTFNLTEVERSALIKAVPNNQKYVKVRFYIKTTINSVEYKDYVEKTFTLINGEPTFSNISITDSNSATTKLTGDANKLIKYSSNAKISFTASPKYGASISSYKVVCGDKSITSNSGTINSIESGKFTITATDSRGFTTTQTVSKTIVEYVKLTNALDVEITNPAQGIINYTISGSQFNGSFGAVNNQIIRKIKYREVGTANWTETSALTSNTGSLTLDYTKSWEIKSIVSDKIYTTPIESKVHQIVFEPSFYWDKDNFYFNQDIHIKGFNLIDALFYKDKEEVTINWRGASFVTSSGTQLFFTVPLGKSMGIVNKVEINSISLCGRGTLKGTGTYIIGSGNSNQDCKATGYTTTCSVSDNKVNINITKTSAFKTVDGVIFNNQPLGISAIIKLKFSYDSSITTNGTETDIIDSEITAEGE